MENNNILLRIDWLAIRAQRCVIPAVPRSDSFVIMSDTLAGDS
jgi:hypothetical protein